MGSYSINVFGVDISDHFVELEEHIADDCVTQGLKPENFIEGYFDLGVYLEALMLGAKHFDGSGRRGRQMSYIGIPAETGPRGVMVTDEQVARVETMLSELPPELSAAIVAVMGELPKPSFFTLVGWQ